MGARSRILASGRLGDVERRAALGPEDWIAAIVVTGFIGAAALLGGLGDRTVESVDVAADTVYSSELLDLTVHDARAVDALPDQYIEAKAGTRLLVVRMTITDRWDLPISADGYAAGVTTSLFSGKHAVVLPADTTPVGLATGWYAGTENSTAPVFQPGVTTEVEVAWQVPANAVEGDTVAIALRQATPKHFEVFADERSIMLATGDVEARFEVPLTKGDAG